MANLMGFLLVQGSLGSNGWLLHTTLNPLVGVDATICSLYDVLLVVVAGSDLGADLPCWVEVACSVLTCFLCEMLVDVWDDISYGFCCYGLGLLVFPMGGGCSSAVGFLIRVASGFSLLGLYLSFIPAVLKWCAGYSYRLLTTSYIARVTWFCWLISVAYCWNGLGLMVFTVDGCCLSRGCCKYLLDTGWVVYGVGCCTGGVAPP
ncbi:hypothetical protein D5086_027212 [Populus alba]|uniref:Uncharacterized protein n=1 Tax=Populus alba TaxID=43335 RepID=A0ACC4B3Z1_POPAL